MENPISGESKMAGKGAGVAAGGSAAIGKSVADRRYAQLDRAMSRTQYRQDSLIEVLHTAQELFGYLSEDVLLYVARNLKVPTSQVYGVATFYNFFSLEPKGKHTCTVCLGTACYVKGSANIMHALAQNLGITPGKTTPDGLISLEGARCIGACGLAPAVVFDGEIGAQMTPEKAVARVREMTSLTPAGGSEE
jgi:bidirectional [NiFe] hydrogenase diaphorase subunit